MQVEESALSLHQGEMTKLLRRQREGDLTHREGREGGLGGGRERGLVGGRRGIKREADSELPLSEEFWEPS